MPQITIQRGDTLSALALKYGTSVGELIAANANNPSVKSANLIIAGGQLNIPDRVAAPPSGPTAGVAPGSLAVPPVEDMGARAVGDLGNLRISLRAALNEAARKRIENTYKQVAPLAGGVPGTIGSVVDMIRAGIKTPVEQTFSDIISSYKEENALKQKEIDEINKLRLEYGSAIPANVTDLETAISLIAPLIDKERELEKQEKLASINKARETVAEDNDIESWAQSYAKGEVAIGNVPAKIRTAVKVRADAIIANLEVEAEKEYKDRIAFRIEKKTSDFETERALAMQDDNLTVVEQREVLDYIDSLEQQQKAAKKEKKRKGGGFFDFRTPPAAPAPLPPYPTNFTPLSPYPTNFTW